MTSLRKPEVHASFAILSIALLVALGLYLFPGSSYGAGTATAVGCGGTVIGGVNCSAGEPVPADCSPTQMAYEYNDETNFQCPPSGSGYYWSGHKGYCQEDASCSACVPSSACAANTCSTTTCSDSCGNSYAGTQNCTPPPTTCADLGQVGTYPNCSAAPTCTDNSYCSGTTYISSDTCNGQTGSTPNSTSCGYVAPSSCTPSSACAASTPVGSTCSDSCGNTYSGTVASGCGTPSATLTAAPIRVRSGQTSTLTLSAIGVTTSCTVTGPGVNSTTAASSCGVSKTIVTPAITSQVTYKVTCDSTTEIAKIIVNLVPKVIEF